MRYSISLDRIIGRYVSGKYAYGGNFLFCKKNNLTDAKKEVFDEFQRGYYNHATIYDRETGGEIERFTGGKWKELTA